MIFRCSTFWCARKVKLFFEAKPLMCLCCFMLFPLFQKVFFFQKVKWDEVRHQKTQVKTHVGTKLPVWPERGTVGGTDATFAPSGANVGVPTDPAFVPTENADLVSGSWITSLQILEGKKTKWILCIVAINVACFVEIECLDDFLWDIYDYVMYVFFCFWFSFHVFSPGCQDVIWRIVYSESMLDTI